MLKSEIWVCSECNKHFKMLLIESDGFTRKFAKSKTYEKHETAHSGQFSMIKDYTKHKIVL